MEDDEDKGMTPKNASYCFCVPDECPHQTDEEDTIRTMSQKRRHQIWEEQDNRRYFLKMEEKAREEEILKQYLDECWDLPIEFGEPNTPLPTQFLYHFSSNILSDGMMLSPFYKELDSNSNLRTRFRDHLEMFISDILSYMANLPNSPGRKEITKEETEHLIYLVDTLNNTLKFFRRTISWYGPLWNKRKFPENRKTYSELLTLWLTDTDEYRKYHVLDEWVQRRKPYRKKQDAAYRARPEVKEQKKKNRPSKEAEALRQRLRRKALKAARSSDNLGVAQGER